MIRANFQLHIKAMLLLAGALLSSIIYGQTKEDAIFYAIWSDSSKPELDRVNAFFNRLNDIQYFMNNSAEESKWHASSNEAIELASKLDKKEYLPLFYLSSAFKYAINQDDYENGCIAANKVIEYSKLADASSFAVFVAYDVLAYACAVEIEEEDFIREFNKAESSLSDTPHDIESLRNLNFILGNWLISQDQYPKALIYTQKSLRLSEDLDLIDGFYSSINQKLAVIHSNIGNYREAEKYLDKSLVVSHTLEDTFNLGSTYFEMANLQLKLKDEIQAQRYIDSAIYIMKTIQCESCLQIAKIVNAGIKNLTGNHSGALSELKEIEDYYNQQSGDSNIQAEFFLEKANAYLGLKKYDDAIKVLSASRHTGQSYFKAASDKYAILVKVYEAKGEFKKALEYYKQYVQIEDSLTTMRNSSEVTRLELENQFTRQQLKTELDFQAQLNKQKSGRNWIMLLGISALLFAIAVFSRLQYIRKTQKILQRKNEIIEIEKEKAQASERAKHQFLANMSHEIRTPMNAIKGMTDILIRRHPKEEQIEYLSSIKQSSDSLLIIINDILDISKIEAGKIELEHEPFLVNDLVDNVQAIMKFKAEEKGLELKTYIPAVPIFVNGDATRLRQILINLIGNSVKFTEKGLVTTTLEYQQVGDILHLHFTVSDTGIGMDEDRLDKIFKSFEQAYNDTSRKFGGTGLGLSISKMLVELHNGKIWVESKKNKGSQFHFTIPYEIAQAVRQETRDESVNINIAEDLKGIKILLVEDNQYNVIVAKEELEDAIKDVQVEVAGNGVIAVEKVKTSRYDVILMDVQMPAMNGYEATIAIRALEKEQAATPIIAMTANVLKEEVDLCFQVGMNDFIGKPFNTAKLLQKIHTLNKKP
jgi:signal transduction histidine kinase/ActR/RegA family two-component response regulator